MVAVDWGIFRHVPARFALPFVFYPFSWPILLVGYGVRPQMIGKADLFAVGIIGFLFQIPAVIAALFGLELWRRWWVRRRNCGFIPAIPGLFLGLVAYSLVQMGIQYLRIV